jgi:hypothetical protein
VGQDNGIYAELLGLTRDEINDLSARHII